MVKVAKSFREIFFAHIQTRPLMWSAEDRGPSLQALSHAVADPEKIHRGAEV